MFWILLFTLVTAHFTGFLTAPVFWSLVAAYALFKALTTVVDTRWVTRRRYNEAIAENAGLRKQLNEAIKDAGDALDKVMWAEAKGFQSRKDGRQDVLHLYLTDRPQFDRLVRQYYDSVQTQRPQPSGKKPWWEVLGVSSRATYDEIERAYKKLVKQFHPDRNPGDKAAADRMAEINVAKDEADKLFA